MYRLDWKSNRMVAMKEHGELPKGTRIFANGPGADDAIYATTGKKNERGLYELVKLSTNFEGSFWAPFDTLDKYALPISEKFGIGKYYDTNAPLADDDELEEAIDAANAFLAEQERLAKEREDEWNRKQQEILAEYGDRYPRRHGLPEAKEIAKNIRADLREAFPGQTFSVRKDGYNCVNVNWEDGPTEKEVKAVVNKWQNNSHLDYTGDYMEHEDTIFTATFGGVDYLFCQRGFTQETLAKMTAEVAEFCPAIANERQDFLNPKGQWNIAGMDALADRYPQLRDGNRWGRKVDAQDIAFEILDEMSLYQAPETHAKAKSEEMTGGDAQRGIKAVIYSDKALAVFGDTKPLKDILRELRGKFCAHLTIDGNRTAGWVFSRRLYENEQSFYDALATACAG